MAFFQIINLNQIIRKMSKMANSVFCAFLRQLNLTSPKKYTNKKRVIQSSVGMIFKLYTSDNLRTFQDVIQAQYENIELLFTQRAAYEKDRNAYNIVFPGGQCDNLETDLQACKRELYEEINLKVDEQCIYLGQLPQNFYYLQKRGSKVYISCHVWCLKQNELKWKQKLNQAELRKSKWMSYQELLQKDRYVVSNAVRLGFIERMTLKFKFTQNISKNITNVKLPELNLGMDRNLWGLTLWLWSFSLHMAYRNLIEDNTIEKVTEQSLQTLKYQIDHSKLLQVSFRDYYPLKYPVLMIINVWHLMNRVRPFSYERRNQTRAKVALVVFIIVMCAIFSFLN